jgi:hypothetical protein
MQPRAPAVHARTPATDPILVRIPEACRISGLSRSAIYKLNRAALLKFRKFGRTTLVDFASLKAAIAALPST